MDLKSKSTNESIFGKKYMYTFAVIKLSELDKFQARHQQKCSL